MLSESEAGRFDGQEGKTKGKKILVVDDSDATRSLLTSMLAQSGFVPTPAADGIEALTVAETEPFDLVLTDLEMARLNGVEMIRILRERRKDLPIVVFTSSGAHITSAMEAGADHILIKPDQIDEVVESINNLLCT
jgi:DNA-binding response OmpR family regulator